MKTFFTCPHCGASLQIDESLADSDVMCPMCRNVAPNASPASSETDLLPSSNPYASPACLPNDEQVPQIEGDLDMIPVRVRFANLCRETFRICFRYYPIFLLVGIGQMLPGLIAAQGSPQPLKPIDIPFPVVAALCLFGGLFGLYSYGYAIRAAVSGKRWSFRHLAIGPRLLLGILWGCFRYLASLVCAYLAFAVGILLPYIVVAQFMWRADSTSESIILITLTVVGIFWFFFLVISVLRYVFARSFFLSFMLDKQVGPNKAFVLSKKYTNNNFDVFILFVLCMIPLYVVNFVLNVPFSFLADYLNRLPSSPQLSPLVLSGAYNLLILMPVSYSFFIAFYLLMTNRTAAKPRMQNNSDGREEIMKQEHE